MSFSLKDFRIHIPPHLIAQYPLEIRGQSRLLVVDTKKGILIDDFFINIVNYITSSDCIVYNNAKVINARLFGVKNGTSAHLEVLLTRRLSNTEWMCIVRPARRVKKGTKISIDRRYFLEIIEYLGEGLFRARFSRPIDYEELKTIGEIPLPKYIKRKPVREIDEHRYQTIYSNKYGAVASPTAGLHFTQEILEKIQQTGAVTVPITLYVDWGTFKPVREEDYRAHKIHSEIYEITESSAHILNRCVAEKRRMLCIGTTSVRTIETAVTSEGRVASGRGETDLFIYPGYHFKLVDALITNFHIPDSTLLLLVAAFAGKELIEKAYNHAVSKGYRFFSYGDAMLIKK